MASETPLLHIFYSYPSTFVTLHHAPSTLRLPRNSTSSLIYKDSLVRSCSLESFPQLCIAPLRKKKSQVWSVQGFIWICYIYIYIRVGIRRRYTDLLPCGCRRGLIKLELPTTGYLDGNTPRASISLVSSSWKRDIYPYVVCIYI